MSLQKQISLVTDPSQICQSELTIIGHSSAMCLEATTVFWLSVVTTMHSNPGGRNFSPNRYVNEKIGL